MSSIVNPNSNHTMMNFVNKDFVAGYQQARYQSEEQKEVFLKQGMLDSTPEANRFKQGYAQGKAEREALTKLFNKEQLNDH